MGHKRIFLSPPHMGGEEQGFVRDAFASNYIAPLGPQVDQFEKEFADEVGAQYATAVSSGTAALHLALRYAGVKAGDEVVCSSFTFVASPNAIHYLGAQSVFIDSDQKSWNMDPHLLADFFKTRALEGRLPKAVLLVHIYGQSADINPIMELCAKYGVALIEDAAESLGATYRGKAPGTFGWAGIFSFNGNKIITTSGGGMIVSDDEELIQKVKYWATQARDHAIHYEHSEIGYNYRMSNILAAIGRGQLKVLQERVEQKRKLFDQYEKALEGLPGVSFMPEQKFGRSTRWLTCLTIDSSVAGIDRDQVIESLDKKNIESRPTWKPMHLQPLYQNCEVIGGRVVEKLFKEGLCLPSGTAMTQDDIEQIISIIQNCFR